MQACGFENNESSACVVLIQIYLNKFRNIFNRVIVACMFVPITLYIIDVSELGKDLTKTYIYIILTLVNVIFLYIHNTLYTLHIETLSDTMPTGCTNHYIDWLELRIRYNARKEAQSPANTKTWWSDKYLWKYIIKTVHIAKGCFSDNKNFAVGLHNNNFWNDHNPTYKKTFSYEVYVLKLGQTQ